MQTATKPTSLSTKISMAFFAMLTAAVLCTAAYLFWVDSEIYVSGNETTATIVGKWTKVRNTPRNREALTHNIAHYVRYRFTPYGSPSFADSQIVSKGFYDSVTVGTKVTVRYAKNNPDFSQVDRAEGSIGKFVALAIGLALAAGLFYAWRHAKRAIPQNQAMARSIQ